MCQDRLSGVDDPINPNFRISAKYDFKIDFYEHSNNLDYKVDGVIADAVRKTKSAVYEAGTGFILQYRGTD